MCPEGLSMSDTYCQPSASSSQPSGAPTCCLLHNAGATLSLSISCFPGRRLTAGRS